jgi:hypothetical protein
MMTGENTLTVTRGKKKMCATICNDVVKNYYCPSWEGACLECDTLLT